MNKFMIRTLTSIVFVIVLVGSILWSEASYAVLFSVITAMTVWEFCSIVNKNANLQVNRFITTVAGTYLFLAVLSFNLNVCGSEIFIPYIISIIYLLVSELYFDRQNSIYNWAFALMAQLYIALPLASINTLAFISLPQPYSVPSVVYVPMLVLSVFIFLWCNDAGAYCVGSLIGKHKLFPRISPAKSWEGSIGGGIIAILASQAIAYFAKEFLGPCPLTNPLAWAGLAIVVVVFGTWGDLVESLLKRKLGIKDSGNILPGHGGMLDRFDSSLLAFPAAVVYIYTITLYF
jgi:phosphatidate cytidylyltransferase